ncbi:DUF3473 domain-containing protein, partial [candidate division KSB1 bacterium]|nr:DUF3473 domain-containing protein [candidate division KSB1 bacterium]NIR70389.1 DUF3473 domain-containing protein [candidate division KSB1 bacterium]NIS23068.1 DUF3473 domain-containing protein [candidate division KSB1 bacterium]NIT71442.1 DUF3473 domain-containing protein [candidate division KSB1 bacterium]NIU25116.1 DUF3473 domain-containing protein [candidate division KSB1 bacterium]
RATFFTVGWLAEHYPNLVREVADAGHEMACHSYWHRRVSELTPSEFREDIHRNKVVLEDISGKAVTAFRAPTYSIVKSSEWAWDILIEEGFKVDSSVFPIHHKRYGNPNSERFPHEIQRETGTLIVFPLSTVRIAGNNIPIVAGGYLRFFPYSFTKFGINKINQAEKQPAVIAFHPWELDPFHPMPKVSALKRFRHKVNIEKTEQKLRQLLNDFKFDSMQGVLNQYFTRLEGVKESEFAHDFALSRQS